MATTEEVQEFLAAYTDSWQPDRGWSRRIFHPGGGVRYPGSDELVNPDEPPAMTDRLRNVAPDLGVRLVSWAERDDVLFAEWELHCTLQGRPFSIVAVNRFHLDGARARAADAFLDRMSLLEFMEPTRERVTLGNLVTRAAMSSPKSRGAGA